MVARPSIIAVLVGVLASLGASYPSQNFVVDAPNMQIAQQVAQYAEHYRREKALQWLGQEMPRWGQPCPLKVTISMQGSGGATSFAFDNGRILSMDMHIEGTLDRLLASVLPHEVTHTVFAHYFRCPVPRWADEGGAVMSEDEEEQQRHQELAQQILATPGRAIPLKRLLALKNFPSDVMVLFAEGYAVTRFLVERRDHQTLLRFVKDAEREGWDKAVKEHYGLDSVEELEAVWLTSMRRKGKENHRELEDKISLPKEPAPTTTRAVITPEGRLGVHRLVQCVRPVIMKVNKDGEPLVNPVSTYVRGTVTVQTRYDLNRVSAFDVHGNPIEEKKLRKLLARETTVVVSADGQKVAPFYLSVLKEETIVLVVPQAEIPPPPAPTSSPVPPSVPATPIDP